MDRWSVSVGAHQQGPKDVVGRQPAAVCACGNGLHARTHARARAAPCAQAGLLQRCPHIIVATPGRLLDLIDDGLLTVGPLAHSHDTPQAAARGESGAGPGAPGGGATGSGGGLGGGAGGAAGGSGGAAGGAEGGAGRAGTAYVVLDEADKMLSLGFKPQLDLLRGMLLGAPAPPAGAKSAKGVGKKAERALQRAGAGGAGRPQVGGVPCGGVGGWGDATKCAARARTFAPAHTHKLMHARAHARPPTRAQSGADVHCHNGSRGGGGSGCVAAARRAPRRGHHHRRGCEQHRDAGG